VPQDPFRQLLDLVAVHGFYLSLLEGVTGEAVPIPRGTSAADPKTSPVEHSISVLRRWLNLLDMAIAPPMFRDALRDPVEPATGEALLRYYVLKTSHTDTDRDKCDFVNTHLYRAWRRQLGLSEAPGEAVEIPADAALRYEGEIYTMLGEVEPPALPQEHLQLAREFEHLRQEVDELSHFDSIIDSGILQRVREIKASFARSFYHPHVLAEVAVYNAFFGRKFDELFRQAAADIKSFAQHITEAGGSIMTRVNDDVTVKELADVEEQQILHEEYGKARDKLRKFAQFKKAVDTRRKGRYTAPLPAAAAAGVSGPGAMPSNVVAISGATAPAMPFAAPPPVTLSGEAQAAIAHRLDDNKIHNASDMIRNFIMAAEKSFANVVPLRNSSLLLTPAEVDAFRNPYLNEKSFRADFAAALRRVVATMAATAIEMEAYKRKKGSAYLWKQHADSLRYFATRSAALLEEARGLQRLAAERGLNEKVKVLEASSERLRQQTHEIGKLLQR
jgi:hypothetical protein